jgi:hypothetical protein
MESFLVGGAQSSAGNPPIAVHPVVCIRRRRHGGRER